MEKGRLIFFIALVLLTNAFPSRALSSSSRSLHQDEKSPSLFRVLYTSSMNCEVYGGNGKCDDIANNEDCNYDDGDCCKCTCVGDNCANNTPFSNCVDPDAPTDCGPTPSTTATQPTPGPTPMVDAPSPFQLTMAKKTVETTKLASSQGPTSNAALPTIPPTTTIPTLLPKGDTSAPTTTPDNFGPAQPTIAPTKGEPSQPPSTPIPIFTMASPTIPLTPTTYPTLPPIGNVTEPSTAPNTTTPLQPSTAPTTVKPTQPVLISMPTYNPKSTTIVPTPTTIPTPPPIGNAFAQTTTSDTPAPYNPEMVPTTVDPTQRAPTPITNYNMASPTILPIPTTILTSPWVGDIFSPTTMPDSSAVFQPTIAPTAVGTAQPAPASMPTYTTTSPTIIPSPITNLPSPWIGNTSAPTTTPDTPAPVKPTIALKTLEPTQSAPTSIPTTITSSPTILPIRTTTLTSPWIRNSFAPSRMPDTPAPVKPTIAPKTVEPTQSAPTSIPTTITSSPTILPIRTTTLTSPWIRNSFAPSRMPDTPASSIKPTIAHTTVEPTQSAPTSIPTYITSSPTILPIPTTTLTSPWIRNSFAPSRTSDTSASGKPTIVHTTVEPNQPAPTSIPTPITSSPTIFPIPTTTLTSPWIRNSFAPTTTSDISALAQTTLAPRTVEPNQPAPLPTLTSDPTSPTNPPTRTAVSTSQPTGNTFAPATPHDTPLPVGPIHPASTPMPTPNSISPRVLPTPQSPLNNMMANPTATPTGSPTTRISVMPTMIPTKTPTSLSAPTRTTTESPIDAPRTTPTPFKTLIPRVVSEEPSSEDRPSPTPTRTAAPTRWPVVIKKPTAETGFPTASPTTPPTTAPDPVIDSPLRSVTSVPNTPENINPDTPTSSVISPLLPILETDEPNTPSSSTNPMPSVISSISPTPLLTFEPSSLGTTESSFGPTRAPAPSVGDQTSPPFVTVIFMSRSGASETVSIAAVGGIAASILGAILSQESLASIVTALQPTGEFNVGINMRKSSATLAYLLTSQLQFLATLSLVDNYSTGNKLWIQEFGTDLRWINLWWPESFDDKSSSTRWTVSSSSTCNWEDSGLFVSVGNLALVAGILLCMFLLHLLIISGFEAYWLMEKQAKVGWKIYPRRGMTGDEFMVRISGTPACLQAPSSADIDRKTGGDTVALDVEAPTPAPIFNNFAFEGEEEKEEEKDSMVDNRSRHDVVDPIAVCRDMSSSAWLHFPHVELLFLLFAFEGFIAAQVYGAHQSECLPAQIVAAVVLVLYPALMFMGVCRTMLVRVYSKAIIEFRWLPDDDKTGHGCMTRSIISWRHDHSLFSWGDKGRWETVQTSNEGIWRKRNWFRIGFEPVFVDFTQSGAYFTIVFLVELILFGCIGVLVESGTVQLFLFCGIHLGEFIALAIFRPFANKVLDFVASMVAFVNAVSMALMAASTLAWSSATDVTKIDIAVAFLQLLLLLVLVVPIYANLLAVIMEVVETRSCCKQSQEESIDQDENAFVRGFIWHTWAMTWYKVLGHNLYAYMNDIREGIRSPHASLEHARQP